MLWGSMTVKSGNKLHVGDFCAKLGCVYSVFFGILLVLIVDSSYE